MKDYYYCSFCHVRIEGDDVVVWRNEKPYHKHHAKHHKPDSRTIASISTAIRLVPRFSAHDAGTKIN